MRSFATLATTSILLAACLLSAPTWAGEGVIQFREVQAMFGGEIYVPCAIDGLAQECKLDTGTNMTSVRTRAEYANYASRGRLTEKTSSGSVISCELIRVNQFSLGSWEQPQFDVARCPSPDLKSGTNLIGLDFLRAQPFVLDYKAGEFRFGASAEPRGTLQQSTSNLLGQIIVPVQIKKSTVVFGARAMVDSGAAITFVSQDLVQSLPEAFTLISESSATDTHGNQMTSKLYIANQILVGDVRFVGEYVMAIDFTGIKSFAGNDVEMIIGHNLMKQARWYFDLNNARWSVTSGESK